MDSSFSLNNAKLSEQKLAGLKDNNLKTPYSAQLHSHNLKNDTVSFTSKKEENKTFLDKVKDIFKKDSNGKMPDEGKTVIACAAIGISAAVGLFMYSRGKGAKATKAALAENILDMNNSNVAGANITIKACSAPPTDALMGQIFKKNDRHHYLRRHHHYGHHNSHTATVDVPRLDNMTLPKREPVVTNGVVNIWAATAPGIPAPPKVYPDDFLTRKILSDIDVDSFIDNFSASKAFEDVIKNEDDLKKFLTKYFDTSADTSKYLDSIMEKYKKDNSIAELVYLTAHTNYSGCPDAEFKALDAILNSACAVSEDGKIDARNLAKFIKLESYRRGYQLQGDDLMHSIENDFELFKNNKKFCAAIADINPAAKDYQLDPYRILRQAKENNRNPEDILEFINSLKQGNVLNRFETLETGLLQNPDFDLKIGTKFMNSLNADIKGRLDIETIKKIITDPNIDAKQISQRFNELPKDMVAKYTSADGDGFILFSGKTGVTNINELNMIEKKMLLKRAVQANSDLFMGKQNTGSELFPILPKNKDEYCSLLQKLTKSIGIDTKPLTEAEQKAFEAGLKNAASNISKANLDDVHFALDIPRQDFIQKARKAMEGLDDAEKNKVMDYFGFELQDIVPNKSNGLKHTLHTMKGYPINVNNGIKLAEIESAETKKVIEDVRKIVQEFSENNGVKLVSKNGAALTPEQKALEADLNEIFKGLPELRSIIGRKQHQTHVFSLDEHTFRVFQGVTQNPKFEKLSDSDKKVLSIASLLHDVTKAEGLRDAMHPAESAFDAFHITQKLNLSEDERVKVYELIKSHNWLDKMCAKTKDGVALPAQKVQELAQDIAFDARHTNTFDLAKILCEADMKAVKPNGAFFEKHKGSFDGMSAYVDKYLENIHNTQIILPQTRIPKASAIKNGVQKTADGVTNTVLYMDDIKGDMSKYGFKKGTTKENWRGLVHALDDKNQMSKFDTFSLIDSDALLSTSYIDANNYKVFRKQGFVLDVDYNDIHAGYYRDFGTGYKKDIELLKSDYLFHGDRKSFDDKTEYRKYISSLIKKEMGITNDAEYTNMVKQIQSAKSITEISEINPKLADALDNVFSSMEAGKRRGGRQYNEMLASRPKIQAVFGYDKEYEKIPKFLREYAQDNDIPILIFGKSSSVA